MYKTIKNEFQNEPAWNYLLKEWIHDATLENVKERSHPRNY